MEPQKYGAVAMTKTIDKAEKKRRHVVFIERDQNTVERHHLMVVKFPPL